MNKKIQKELFKMNTYSNNVFKKYLNTFICIYLNTLTRLILMIIGHIDHHNIVANINYYGEIDEFCKEHNVFRLLK